VTEAITASQSWDAKPVSPYMPGCEIAENAAPVVAPMIICAARRRDTKLSAACATARFEVLPGTGHLPQMETPDLVFQTIRNSGQAPARDLASPDSADTKSPQLSNSPTTYHTQNGRTRGAHDDMPKPASISGSLRIEIPNRRARPN
jgi:hypothetical protein